MHNLVFLQVGRFFHSLFDHCYMTDDEMKQWVSMLVTFILDLKYLTIFSEFQTGTRYWKAIEDEVGLILHKSIFLCSHVVVMSTFLVKDKSLGSTR